MSKLNKQSSGVGNYLKYKNDDGKDEELSCQTCDRYLTRSEACAVCINYSSWIQM